MARKIDDFIIIKPHHYETLQLKFPPDFDEKEEKILKILLNKNLNAQQRISKVYQSLYESRAKQMTAESSVQPNRESKEMQTSVQANDDFTNLFENYNEAQEFKRLGPRATSSPIRQYVPFTEQKENFSLGKKNLENFYDADQYFQNFKNSSMQLKAGLNVSANQPGVSESRNLPVNETPQRFYDQEKYFENWPKKKNDSQRETSDQVDLSAIRNQLVENVREAGHQGDLRRLSIRNLEPGKEFLMVEDPEKNLVYTVENPAATIKKKRRKNWEVSPKKLTPPKLRSGKPYKSFQSAWKSFERIVFN